MIKQLQILHDLLYSIMGCLLRISDLILKVMNKMSWVVQQIFQKTPDGEESCVLVPFWCSEDTLDLNNSSKNYGLWNSGQVI